MKKDLKPKTYNLKPIKGFTLIELLIYTGLSVIVGGLTVGTLLTVTQINQNQSASAEVSGQMNFVLQRMQQLVSESSNIDIDAGQATSTVKLRMEDSEKDPTCIYLSSGVIKLAEGPTTPGSGVCTSNTSDLTNSKVVVNTFNLKKMVQYPGHDTLSIDMTMSYNSSSSGSQVSRSLSSAIGRVSAATFDANVIPGSDNAYDLGSTPSTRWRNGVFSGNLLVNGNIGVGTTTPSVKLEVYGGMQSGTAVAGGNVENLYKSYGDIPAGVVALSRQTSSLGSSGVLGVNYSVNATQTGAGRYNTSEEAWALLMSNVTGYDYTELIHFAANGTKTVPLHIDGLTGNVGFGVTDPGAKISFPSLTVSTSTDGITWYSITPTSYGIYKTAGAWSAPNYQQLQLSFATGIIIDGGSAFGKSGTVLQPSAGNVGIGTTDLSAAKLTVNGTVKASAPVNDSDLTTKAWVLANAGGGTPADWTCTTRAGNSLYVSQASCSGTEKLITGGCSTQGFWYSGVYYPNNTYPSNQSWYCLSNAYYVTYNTAHYITAYAQCCY